MKRALAILLAALLALPPLTVAPAFAAISEEKKLGNEFISEALAGLPLVHDYELVMFVRKMGYRLVATLGNQPFDYEFFVVRETSPALMKSLPPGTENALMSSSRTTKNS